MYSHIESGLGHAAESSAPRQEEPEALPHQQLATFLYEFSENADEADRGQLTSVSRGLSATINFISRRVKEIQEKGEKFDISRFTTTLGNDDQLKDLPLGYTSEKAAGEMAADSDAHYFPTRVRTRQWGEENKAVTDQERSTGTYYWAKRVLQSQTQLQLLRELGVLEEGEALYNLDRAPTRQGSASEKARTIAFTTKIPGISLIFDNEKHFMSLRFEKEFVQGIFDGAK